MDNESTTVSFEEWLKFSLEQEDSFVPHWAKKFGHFVTTPDFVYKGKSYTVYSTVLETERLMEAFDDCSNLVLFGVYAFRAVRLPNMERCVGFKIRYALLDE